MTTAATHHEHENTTEATLFVAFELSEKNLEARLHHGPWSKAARAHRDRTAAGARARRNRPGQTPLGSAGNRARGQLL